MDSPTPDQMDMMDDMAEFARSEYFRLWLLTHPQTPPRELK